MISIYTDGACSCNPGPGASATIIIKDDRLVHRDVRFMERTTNNIAELVAVLNGIKYAIEHNITECVIFCDSAYVVNGINQWMEKWADNGWRSSTKDLVKNCEIWQEIRHNWKLLRSLSNCSIVHVKGHNGNKWNDIVDEIAKSEIKRANGKSANKNSEK